PPSLYDDIIANLGAAGLGHVDGGWTRIIIEKPFGRDLDSARALNRQLTSVFDEEQVYRIDHYLGKETVQNILVFRFANGIFEAVWNRNHVAEVQITVAETIGVEGRGSYYEEAGALRDMVQNHMLQLLCLIAMEPPVTFDADPVRDEKNKVMHAIRPIDPAKVDDVALRAHYGPGYVDGGAVPGYRQEKGVKPDSTTETYAALRLEIDSWRWAGVPFYLRTGKRLAKRASEIAIRFRRTPHMIFRRSPTGVEADLLAIRIQPDEGISLTVLAKEPGPDLKLAPVTLDFKYGEVFGGEPPEAYERLLLDAIHGDATLYARGDWVEQAWALLEPVLEAWSRTPAALAGYETGSWGPPGADGVLRRDGGSWGPPGHHPWFPCCPAVLAGGAAGRAGRRGGPRRQRYDDARSALRRLSRRRGLSRNASCAGFQAKPRGRTLCHRAPRRRPSRPQLRRLPPRRRVELRHELPALDGGELEDRTHPRFTGAGLQSRISAEQPAARGEHGGSVHRGRSSGRRADRKVLRLAQRPARAHRHARDERRPPGAFPLARGGGGITRRL